MGMVGGYQGWLTAVLTAVLVASTAAQSKSDGEMPSCVWKLAACAAYINATTTPPASCCNPLKEVVTKEKDCLCGIYNNPDFLQAFNINLNQALNLPKLCHFDSAEDNICKAPSPSATGSTPSSPGSGSGSGSGSGGKSVADKITGTGLVSSLLVFGTCLIFY